MSLPLSNNSISKTSSPRRPRSLISSPTTFHSITSVFSAGVLAFILFFCYLIYISRLTILYSHSASYARVIKASLDIHSSSVSPASLPNVQQIHHDPNLLRTVFTTVEHDLRIPPPKDLTLLLTLTNDFASWGRMTDSPIAPFQQVWTFSDYIGRIAAQSLPPASLHFGLLTSSIDAYENYTTTLASIHNPPWSYAEVIYLKQLPTDLETNSEHLTREDRHILDDEKQWSRRRLLARLRNFLATHMLRPDHKHIIWLDADVYHLPNDLFDRFIELGNLDPSTDLTELVKAGLREVNTTITHEDGDEETVTALETPPPIGLITLRCEKRSRHDFDRNAWTGFGKRPPSSALAKMRAGKKYPGEERWAKAISQLIVDTTDDDLVKLDSVGGTALYIKAGLVREGLEFPQYLVEGTEWGKDGRDGVETEGLCYVAERMGWGCYGLGGRWVTKHADA
ncbi:hypothetical protein ABW19_dt0200640 [Dactylella cylindrospora]|nr:hypothetical protein ABW19_dt0200640 [Dactylella cylindrospora]